MIDFKKIIADLEIVGDEVHTKYGTTEGDISYMDFIYDNVTESKETLDNIIKSYFGENSMIRSTLEGVYYKGSITE